MIIFLFLGGFLLGLAYVFIGEKVPSLLPEVNVYQPNSWILNLFLAIIHALVVLISYYEYGFSYDFYLSLIVMALVIIIFISDFKYMIILDSPLIISSILVIILKWLYFGFKAMSLSVLSGIFLFSFLLLIGYSGKIIFHKEALGGGDIKLAFVIGLILSFRLGLVAVILSSLLALPYALASILLNSQKEVPFGPFLIGSMAIIFMFSEKFINLLNFLS